MEHIPKSRPESSVIGRTLAVLGFIAVLIIGMWGSLLIASAVPGALKSVAAAVVSLTSIFVSAEEKIVLSVPSLTISTNEPVTVAWTHEKKNVEGSYTFRYDCAPGVYLTHAASTSTTETIFCNVPFHFLNSNNSITLTPVSENNRYIDVTVYVDFTPNGANQPTVTGNKMLTVVNEDVGSSPNTSTEPEIPVTTTPTTPATPKTTKPTAGPTTTNTYQLSSTTAVGVSNPNGYIDLVPRIIEVGFVDKTTGDFTASSTPSRSKRIAVRFAVENIGTKTSNQFTFNAVLPTFPSYIYSSPSQQTLRPGDRIEFTLGFDSFNKDGNGEFIVNVDPANSQNEKSESNNIAKYTITTSN